MSLRQKQQRYRLLTQLKEQRGLDLVLELPGEPLIYSIKYQIGQRRKSLHVFRNMKFRSIIKCMFPSYLKPHVGVVILIRFYITPMEKYNITKKQLAAETTPAIGGYEICDYLLSFLEMLKEVLFKHYTQIVKIDVEKFYSDNPRTVFKFLRYEHYVNIQNNNTVHAETQAICEDVEKQFLQSHLQGDERNKVLRKKVHRKREDTGAPKRPSSRRRSLHDATPQVDEASAQSPTAPPPLHEAT